MATVASIVGFDLPKENAAEDSHDLLPLLKGTSKKVRNTHVHNTKPNLYAIRHNDWVLVAAESGYVSSRNSGWERKHGYEIDDEQPAELYNLKNDIGQRQNIAEKHPGKVKELTGLLQNIREQGYSAPRLTPK